MSKKCHKVIITKAGIAAGLAFVIMTSTIGCTTSKKEVRNSPSVSVETEVSDNRSTINIDKNGNAGEKVTESKTNTPIYFSEESYLAFYEYINEYNI